MDTPAIVVALVRMKVLRVIGVVIAASFLLQFLCSGLALHNQRAKRVRYQGKANATYTPFAGAI